MVALTFALVSFFEAFKGRPKVASTSRQRRTGRPRSEAPGKLSCSLLTNTSTLFAWLCTKQIKATGTCCRRLPSSPTEAQGTRPRQISRMGLSKFLLTK